MKTFQVVSVNISEKTGEKKRPVEKLVMKENHGIVGDAHAGEWHRQISLLAQEDIDAMAARKIELHPGDFAENITTKGIDLASLPIGTTLTIGECVLEITQIGKQCHQACEIRKQVGDCIMPRRGIFARVLKGGGISRNSVGMWES